MAAGKPLYRSLYFQVIVAIVIVVLLGHFWPATGEAMKPLGDAFIKLIKMMIAPIIFCTVVVGIAGMEDMKKVGKTGGLALLYFEIVSSIALVVGLVLVNLLKPGAGMNVDPASLDTKALAAFLQAVRGQTPDPLALESAIATTQATFQAARSLAQGRPLLLHETIEDSLDGLSEYA